MNAQTILEKIGSDGRQAAAALLKEAREKAEALRASSEAKIVKMREETLAGAKAEAAALEVRMQRMADLEDRKQLLAQKRGLMDEAFAMALEKLKQLTPKQMEDFFLSQLLLSAKGTETLLAGALCDGWYAPAFADRANAALKAAGKPGMLKTAPGRREGATGVILMDEGMEINCTLEALLSSKRLEMEAQVASILYA